MTRTFIQVLGLLLTLESAFFLARGSFALSPEAIAAVGRTYSTYNPFLTQSLAQQTADYRAGMILLVVAFTLQMANMLWAMRWDDFSVNKRGIAYATLIGAIFMAGAWWFADAHASSIEHQVQVLFQREKQEPPRMR